MVIIDQAVTVWGATPTDIEGTLGWITRAGRTCYNAPGGSSGAPDFVAKLMRPDPPHSSVLEHSSIAVEVPDRDYPSYMRLLQSLQSPWIKSTSINSKLVKYGNLRAWCEVLETKDPFLVYAWLDRQGFRLLSEVPRELTRVTVELLTDRAVLAEITRHRDDTAFSVQSQRYVDYKKGIRYIRPSWWSDHPTLQPVFMTDCMVNEQQYQGYRAAGLPPEHSRVCLNSQTATVIVMTAYLPQWDWIFNLRRSRGAYPQMRDLMDKVHAEFVSQGWC